MIGRAPSQFTVIRTAATAGLSFPGDDDVQVLSCAPRVDPVQALNECLRSATGEWIIVLDPGDIVALHALSSLQTAIAATPDADVLYSDEDRLVDGIRVEPFHKPAWSPDRFRCQNYLGRLVAMRRSLVDEVGGFRAELSGAHEWDLLLRLTERARHVVHIDEVLAHRSDARAFDGLPASATERDAGMRAIADHLRRTGFAAAVSWSEKGCYQLDPALDEEPLVSIVIPTAGSQRRVRGCNTLLIENCVRSVVSTSTYTNMEIVCTVESGIDREIESKIQRAAGDVSVVFARSRGPFSFSERINIGVAKSRGDYIVLLNDDIEIATPNWVEQMLMYAREPTVGVVGGTLLYEDGRLQHAGVVMVNGNPGHAFRGFPGTWSGYRRNLDVPMNCLVVTAACLMTRRDTFDAVGGLALALPLNYNDVDFCLKIIQRGLRVVHTPGARLVHFESASRGLAPVHPWELELLTERWATLLDRDPFYSRHFLATADFVVLEGMDGKTAADIPGASASHGLRPGKITPRAAAGRA